MNAWSNYKTNLKLKFYNISSDPFSSIKIFECLSYPYYLPFCEENLNKKLNFIDKNNTYEVTLEKENNLEKHIILFIEIMSKYDINNMIAEATINENFKSENNNTSLIIIIIEIIIAILMISYIIYLIIKCILSK